MDMNLNGNNYSLNEYVEVQTIYDPLYECPITCASFDPQQELYWTGNNEGRVTSYYTASLSKYTSFRVPSLDNPDIKVIFPHVNNVFVLTSDMLSGYSRFGVSNFQHKEVSFQNLQCLFLNQQERFFLGGFSNFIYDFDIERQRILRQLSITDDQTDCILIKSSAPSNNMALPPNSRNGILCTGSSNGQILLRDPFTLKSINKFHPHSGSLSDFDVHGNNLVSCGFSLTRNGLCVDRFLMVYDLRMMRALTPVQMMIEPCFLHYLPMCSSVVAVASQSACFQLTDTTTLNPPNFYQAQVPTLGGLSTTFSMSSNSMSFAFGHSSGSIHLFCKGDSLLFNDYSEPTLIVEPPSITEPYIDINNEIAPLSSVPVPITDQELLSDWPTKANPKYRPTPLILPELLENSRIIHGIISVPNRIDLKRNQIYDKNYKQYCDELEKKASLTSFSLHEFETNPVQFNNEEQSEELDSSNKPPETSSTNEISNSRENNEQLVENTDLETASVKN